MNIWDLLILALVAVFVILGVWRMKKRKPSCCSGACSACCQGCGEKKEKTKQPG